MAWPVKAVDITASASTPGARKSTDFPSPVSTMSTTENKVSSSAGMITVSSSCSPLRSSIRVSSAVWARIIRDTGAAPGRGVNVPALISAAPYR